MQAGIGFFYFNANPFFPNISTLFPRLRSKGHAPQAHVFQCYAVPEGGRRTPRPLQIGSNEGRVGRSPFEILGRVGDGAARKIGK